MILFTDEFWVDDDREFRTMELIVTNGFDRLFRVPLTYAFIEGHRRKLGITGSWQAYFELLCEATKSDAQVKVRSDKALSFEPSQSQASADFFLDVFYPLSAGAKIKGSFDLTQFEIRSVERHKIIQKMLLLLARKQFPAMPKLDQITVEERKESTT